MEDNYAQRAESLTKYLFDSPYWPVSVGVSALFSILVGAASFRTVPTFSGIYEGAIRGFILIGAPAVISVFLTPWITNRIRGELNIDRSALLSSLSSIIVGFGTLIGSLTQIIGPELTYDALMLSLGIIFAIRMMVLLSLSKKTLIGNIPGASVQPLFSIVFLYQFNKTPALYFEFLISSFIFISAFYLIIIYLDRPLRRSFGISGLDFVRGFVNYSHKGVDELESIFDEIGEFVRVPVGTIAFKNQEGVKAVIVSPSVHPGPVGELGGGNLPKALAEDLEEELDCTALIAHGAATHDFNLVNSEQSHKITDSVIESVQDMDFAGAGIPVREKVGDVEMLAQKLDEGIVAISTLSPNPTEDIAFPIGYSIMLNSRVRGSGDLVFIDAHNCSWKEPGGIYPGSKHSFDIIDAAEKTSDKASEKEVDDLKLGIAKKDVEWGWEQGFGNLGIRVALLEIDGKKTYYVFLDGNNLEKGLREKILKALPIDEGEVMTSDNHVVNLNGENPIGAEIDHKELIKNIQELYEKAERDLEEVEVGVETEMVEDLEVFGSDMAAQLASTANAIIAMGGGLAFAFILSAFALSIIAILIT
ncbi:DUF2070 domain-containing protein [archaeon SCG-AAA382B04]|nr:DUF2070 domain-containing protein [archaeon SCG-AAA382B04]